MRFKYENDFKISDSSRTTKYSYTYVCLCVCMYDFLLNFNQLLILTDIFFISIFQCLFCITPFRIINERGWVNKAERKKWRVNPGWDLKSNLSCVENIWLGFNQLIYPYELWEHISWKKKQTNNLINSFPALFLIFPCAIFVVLIQEKLISFNSVFIPFRWSMINN